MHALRQAARRLSQIQGMPNLLQESGVGWFDPGCEEGQLVEQGLVHYDDRSDSRPADSNPQRRAS